MRLLSIDDVIDLYLQLKRVPLSSITKRFTPGRQNAVKAAWDIDESPPKYWYNISAVQERNRYLITGDPHKDPMQYVFEKYLRGKEPLVACSLGSGKGSKEREWCAIGRFSKFEGFELSEKLVEIANVAAKAHQRGELIFHAADLQNKVFERERYDVVFASHSLHHLYPVEKVIKRAKDALKPDGVFIAEEYVGPNRMQWSDVQLGAVNELLAGIPAKYRQRYRLKHIKKRAHRPGILRMLMADRSEAVDSEMIMPSLRKHFSVVELREFGGTILQPLFHDIAQNFNESDVDAMKYVRTSFAKEDEMMANGDLKSDFVFAVCKKPRN